MYDNLYVYGCSHSFGTALNGNNLPYGVHLANKLHIHNIFNKSSASTGNEFNRKLLSSHYFNNEFKENSLIIFQLTGYHRKSFQLINSEDMIKFKQDLKKLQGDWGYVGGILHTLSGMFNRNDSENDKPITDFIDLYETRLSGEMYIMFDDIFSTYSVLKLISHELKNVNFLMVSWPEIKSPFEQFLPIELSNILNWSISEKLTEHDIYDNKDFHLSAHGHEKLADKIFDYLKK